ncbi:hypothetical protein AB9K41_19770 [Cribrihabitans sp. XS_ASV171]
MRISVLVLSAMALSLTAPAAIAKNDKSQGKGQGKPAKVERPAHQGNAPSVVRVPERPASTVLDCPPGLAKKDVPCVPPGQAKRYRVGEILPRDYVWIDDPGRWGLNGNGYVRLGDYVYRIDRETREVLNLIGAVADILN